MRRKDFYEAWDDFIKAMVQLASDPDNPQVLALIDYMAVKHAPHRVYVDGRLIDRGQVEVQHKQEKFTLELPLTRECYDQLPVQLAVEWAEAADAENSWAIRRFTNALTTRAGTLSAPEPQPANGSLPS